MTGDACRRKLITGAMPRFFSLAAPKPGRPAAWGRRRHDKRDGTPAPIGRHRRTSESGPPRHLRDGAGIGADLPPYPSADLDQLSISCCHVGNCSRGRPPTPTSDARCGDAGDDGQVWVGEGGGGLFSRKLARRGHEEQKKKNLKRDHRVKTPPRRIPHHWSSLRFFGCHTPSHLGIRDHSC